MSLRIDVDGRQIEFYDVVTELSKSIYTYSVSYKGAVQDEGYIIVSSLVLEDDEDDEPTGSVLYQLFMVESENVYMTDTPYLFSSIEALLEDISNELVQSTGTQKYNNTAYMSGFIQEINSLGDK